jgi:precorrin-6A synthase
MRRLKLIGIGAGNPDHITLQAIHALDQVDVVFTVDKGEVAIELLHARQEVCRRFIKTRPYRTVEIPDAERERTPVAYHDTVTDWHAKRAELIERAIREDMSEQECGAFLVWGDPALYDSTMRIINLVAAMNSVAFEWEVIPGINSIQALAAAHKISWNEIGAPVHITTGRRLSEEQLTSDANVLVLLDGQCSFKARQDADVDIYWGAYLGTADEILLSGRLGEVSARIEQTRSEARNQKGWIMDTYLLRKRSTPT